MKLTTSNITPGAILVVILSMMAFCLFALRISLAFSYLPELGGVSINVMYGIMRILSGSELYTNPETAPFPIIQYMPLHFYLVASLGKIVGIANDIHHMMVVNRLFCLSLDVASVFIIGRTLVKTIGLKKSVAFPLSCIYFLSIPSIIYARVDNLYLFFFILTLSLLLKLLIRSEETLINKTRILFMSGVFCMLAILTKQTGLFLFAFCSLYFLLLEKSIKQLLTFYLGSIVALIAGAIFLHPDSLLSFKLNVVDGVKNGINPNWFFEVLLKNFFLKFSYILAAGFLISFLLIRESQRKMGYLFIGLGIAWYFLTATATAFKAGSGSNYYLEFITLSIIGGGVLIKKNKGINPHITLFALVLSPFFLIAAANDKGWGDLSMLKKARKNYFNCLEVSGYLKPKLKDGDWVLTDFHKENTLNLLLSDKALFPCREVALYFTRPLGVFHFNEFKKLVDERKITYLVTRKGETLSNFIDVPLVQFEPDTTIGMYQIYRKSN